MWGYLWEKLKDMAVSGATKKMTPKQEQFVREYLIDLNGTQAAIRAGYSEKTAEKIGSENLHKPEIREAIDAALSERSEKTGLTAERVLREIQCMAFYDPSEIMREIGAEDEPEDGSGYRMSDDGKLYGLRGPTDIRALPENVRRAIVGWSWDKAGNFTVKLADKSKALDQLARHLSLYNDKIEVTGLDALADRLARAGGRATVEPAEPKRPRPRDR